ncbi:hypothetical protein [Brevibacillus sp. BC25]|uniref:hypothetical protein n=1 Tax=Brevibacillus sp. BC25 TaxID=1144308 RepID=UPI000270DD6B|nr:hypothetical protein [Brevibacillus sp. BC25]EJL31796.1 hypothetical protein PMI05_00561 [Brevibacillus sp. BC25]
MAFIAHDFSDEHLYDAESLKGVYVRETFTFEVGWKKTITGWMNLRLIGSSDEKVINMSPQCFFDLIPEAGDDAISGVVYMSASRVEELGFLVAREDVIA